MDEKRDRTSTPEQQNPGQQGRTDPRRMKGGDGGREAGRHQPPPPAEQGPRKFGERHPDSPPAGQKRESR
jgi:hypothetical protein